MKKITVFTILSVICCSLMLAQDVTLSLDGSNLNYDSSVDIAGFQFNHDGCASGSSGGDTGGAGFMFSVSSNLVMAFHMQGDVIPANPEGGVLLSLGSEDCTTESLSSLIFAFA